MQNLLVGKSGSGKSYEACVYQILPALQRGRKVITNIPLRLETWEALDPQYHDLIEIRNKPQPIRGTWEPTREEGAYNVLPEDHWQAPYSMARCFSGVWDFYSDWRHPVTGIGPLFVIDEAQNVIPYKKTDQAVEEWTGLHRHWVCDVLWLTQSYGKLSQAIRDNIQMVYRTHKMTAWGKPTKYIRKVQDGIRGEVLNTTQRDYEKRYFSLYRSHTQGQAADEMDADDIVPIWKHWSFKLMAGCALLFVFLLVSGKVKNPISPASYVNTNYQQSGHVVASGPFVQKSQLKKDEVVNAPAVPAAVSQVSSTTGKVSPDPFGPFGIHFVGSTIVKNQRHSFFALSQNGQYLRELTQRELEEAGYKVTYVTQCLAQVQFENVHRYAYCDSPSVGVPMAGQSLDRHTRTSTDPSPPSDIKMTAQGGSYHGSGNSTIASPAQVTSFTAS